MMAGAAAKNVKVTNRLASLISNPSLGEIGAKLPEKNIPGVKCDPFALKGRFCFYKTAGPSLNIFKRNRKPALWCSVGSQTCCPL